MNSLLKKTTIISAISLALYGCGNGVDEGYAYKFKNEFPVEYSTDTINAQYDEESGLQQVNLLEGAMVNGESLTVANSTSPIHITNIRFTPVNNKFVTPQTDADLPQQKKSPFSIGDDGVTLNIDTDVYKEALRMCDETDATGAQDPDGKPMGDGQRDFPQSITYNVDFVVDNGYQYAPGVEKTVRTLVLTINAINDPVESVQAFDVNVSSGDTTPMLSATLPTYACNSNLTYAIANETIASVDTDGMITGNNKGETNIVVTSEENPELSATAKVSVTAGFTLAINNQDFNDIGAPLGTKSVPTCSAIGVEVEPTIIADELTGAYTYDWTSTQVLTSEENDGAFGATGLFANTLATGETADITVGYKTGYTGSTLPNDIQSQMVTVTAERNYACDPLLPTNSDLALDSGNWGGNATHVAGGLDGNALLITSTNDGNLYSNVVQQIWNNQKNFHSATYGLGDGSAGRTFKFSVWAKLDKVPTSEVKLEHELIPWKCVDCDSLANFPARHDAGVTGVVSAVLKPTTDWQLVEFINPSTGNNEWTVPAEFSKPNATTPVFQSWNLYGLANGDTIMLDNYGIVEVK